MAMNADNELVRIVNQWPELFSTKVKGLLEMTSIKFQNIVKNGEASQYCTDHLCQIFNDILSYANIVNIAFVNVIFGQDSGIAYVLRKHSAEYLINKAFYSVDPDFGEELLPDYTYPQKKMDNIKDVFNLMKSDNNFNIQKIIIRKKKKLANNTVIEVLKTLDDNALRSFHSLYDKFKQTTEGGSMIKILGRQRKIVFKGTTKYIRYKNRFITVKEAKLLEKLS